MRNVLRTGLPVLLALLLATGCGTDSMEDETGLTGNSEGYALEEVDGSDISGSIRFEELHGGDTFVTMQLAGVDFEETYELRLHDNTVDEGGPMRLELGEVYGVTGVNEGIINAEDNLLTYDDLIQYDGHVVVHVSENNETLVAAGNIGANANGDE